MLPLLTMPRKSVTDIPFLHLGNEQIKVPLDFSQYPAGNYMVTVITTDGSRGNILCTVEK